MATISTFHESTFAFFIETTAGQPPGYTASLPYGTAAGWATADTGGTADRMRHFEADPSWLRGVSIEDPAMLDSVFQTNKPILGLGPVEGGSIVLGLHGSEAATADGVQISETPLMTFLEHCLGGLARGNTTAVDVTVTSDVDFEVTSTTNLAAGQIVALEDAGATGQLYAARVDALPGGAQVQIDEAPNFTVATGDVLHAVATLYPDASALECGDAGYSTTSLFYQKGEHRWLGVGCKVQLDGVSMPRGEQPKLNFSAWAANAFPPSSSSITEPVWTGSVEGIPGIPVGAKTVLRISDASSSAYVCVDALSFEFEAGVPVVALDTATQCGDNMEGRAGYTTEPASTMLSATVFLDTGWQDDFDNLQDLEVTIEQQSEAGKFWCIKLPLCNLVDNGPEYTQEAATNMQTLRFKAREPSGSTALAKAKFAIGIG